MYQQPCFLVHAAAIPGQRAVCADDPVAGYDDADGVVVICAADGPHSFGIPDAPGLFAVGDGFSVGDGA